jgi:hypothetical protein
MIILIDAKSLMQRLMPLILVTLETGRFWV